MLKSSPPFSPLPLIWLSPLLLIKSPRVVLLWCSSCSGSRFFFFFLEIICSFPYLFTSSFSGSFCQQLKPRMWKMKHKKAGRSEQPSVKCMNKAKLNAAQHRVLDEMRKKAVILPVFITFWPFFTTNYKNKAINKLRKDWQFGVRLIQTSAVYPVDEQFATRFELQFKISPP